MKSAFEPHPRIFIIDDEPEIARMMSVILQMNLFDAIPFADPREALAAARAEPPEYLISDIRMRGMTGIELAVIVQREMPVCKVLLFFGSAGGAGADARGGAGRAQLHVLQKPLHPTELMAAIKAL